MFTHESPHLHLPSDSKQAHDAIWHCCAVISMLFSDHLQVALQWFRTCGNGPNHYRTLVLLESLKGLESCLKQSMATLELLSREKLISLHSSCQKTNPKRKKIFQKPIQVFRELTIYMSHGCTSAKLCKGVSWGLYTSFKPSPHQFQLLKTCLRGTEKAEKGIWWYQIFCSINVTA